VFNGEPQFGLGTLVTSRGVLSTWQVEGDLCLFREFLGKVLEQLFVSECRRMDTGDVLGCQTLVHRACHLVPWREQSTLHRQPR
jgi:hypothetical protein